VQQALRPLPCIYARREAHRAVGWRHEVSRTRAGAGQRTSHSYSAHQQKEYYDRRAPEYDDFWSAAGIAEPEQRAAARAQVDALIQALRALTPARTLDIGCGTGYLTRHLKGTVVGLDQSNSMLRIARRQAPDALLVRGDAVALPFEDGAFDRALASHVYGHLPPGDRIKFRREVKRVASELVLIDSAAGNEVSDREWEERRLRDGSRYLVYKRFFTPTGLLEELRADGTVLLDTPYFVGIAARLA
jgi:SAM-dependent methyltransferase